MYLQISGFPEAHGLLMSCCWSKRKPLRLHWFWADTNSALAFTVECIEWQTSPLCVAWWGEVMIFPTISLAIFSPSPPLGLPQVLDGGGLELWPLHTCSLAPTQGIRMGSCSGWWILTLAILRRSDGYKTKLEIGTRCSCLELFGRLVTALCLLVENKYNRRRINEKFRLCFW